MNAQNNVQKPAFKNPLKRSIHIIAQKITGKKE